MVERVDLKSVAVSKDEARTQIKEKLIELVKKQVEAGAPKRLSDLERDYLEIALGPDLPEKEIARRLGIKIITINKVKVMAFLKIFESQNQSIQEEVGVLFVGIGLGRKSPFARYKNTENYDRNYYVQRHGMGRYLTNQQIRASIVTQAIINGSIDSLTERQRRVVLARYPKKLKTLKELTLELATNGSLTKERVRQIEQSALRKLFAAKKTKSTS